jgi:hypothetical protein
MPMPPERVLSEQEQPQGCSERDGAVLQWLLPLMAADPVSVVPPPSVP